MHQPAARRPRELRLFTSSQDTHSHPLIQSPAIHPEEMGDTTHPSMAHAACGLVQQGQRQGRTPYVHAARVEAGYVHAARAEAGKDSQCPCSKGRGREGLPMSMQQGQRQGRTHYVHAARAEAGKDSLCPCSKGRGREGLPMSMQQGQRQGRTPNVQHLETTAWPS